MPYRNWLQFRAKIGRCRRCMGLTALGLVSSSAAAIAVPEGGYDVLRTALFASAAAFGTVAVTHFGFAVYHALVRTGHEGARACNCGRSRRR
jgi:hypothetical protein